jgi:hypothetical protein
MVVCFKNRNRAGRGAQAGQSREGEADDDDDDDDDDGDDDGQGMSRDGGVVGVRGTGPVWRICRHARGGSAGWGEGR